MNILEQLLQAFERAQEEQENKAIKKLAFTAKIMEDKRKKAEQIHYLHVN